MNILSEFISTEEQMALLTWALELEPSMPKRTNLLDDSATGSRRSMLVTEFMDERKSLVGALKARILDAIKTMDDVDDPAHDAADINMYFIIHEATANTATHDEVAPIRANVLLKAADAGGVFYNDGVEQPLEVRDLVVFKPSLGHGVTMVEEGKRVLVSFKFPRRIVK